MAISQEYIAELSRRIDMIELVGSYVQLKRAGRREKGLCPFHNEKSPSFFVYPETASFYCFGCGAGGDAIHFIKRMQNLTYPEAVRFLAARAGMPMPEEDDNTAKLRGRVLALNRETARFYADCLNTEEGKPARGYLRQRGISDKMIRRFGLGYAPDEFGRLRDALKSLGFREDELVLANVCKKSEKGGVYDTFRHRLVFPIIDLRGSVIAFGGRQLGEYGPKYLNSADTPAFKKSRGLFALNLAKRSASRRFLLAEGYMDVISLHQAGFDTAVATLGTALTEEQARLLSDYADEVVICYDADEAGQKATARAIQIFKNSPVKVRVLDLPNAKDPDEFIARFGAEKFRQVLDGSGNTIEYRLQKEKEQHDTATPDGRANYVRAALDILAGQASPVEQDIYAGRVAEEADVAKDTILRQLDGVVRQKRRQMAKEREKRMRDESMAASVQVPYTEGGNRVLRTAFAEQQLIAAILKDADRVLPMAIARLSPKQFVSPEMAEAYETLVKMKMQGDVIEFSTLSAVLPERITELIGKVLALNYDTGFEKEDVELFITRIENGEEMPRQAAEMTPEELQARFAVLKEKKDLEGPF